MPLKKISLVALALAATVAIGCGSDSPGTAPETSTGSQAAVGHSSSPLDRADCDRLAEFVSEDLGAAVDRSEPFFNPPTYACTFWTDKGLLSVTLDRTRPIRKRFLEQIGSNGLQPVPGLGDPARGRIGAYFSPDANQLYVFRRDGWLDFYVPTATPDPEAKANEVRLARLTLTLLPEEQAEEPASDEGHEAQAGGPKAPGTKSGSPATIISKGDCGRLGSFVTRSLGHRVLSVHATVLPPISACAVTIKGGYVSITLDATPPTRKRFLEDLALSSPPFRPVAGLGDPVQGKAGAYWIPAQYRLYVYGRSGWLKLFWPRAATREEAHVGLIRVGRLARALTEA